MRIHWELIHEGSPWVLVFGKPPTLPPHIKSLSNLALYYTWYQVCLTLNLLSLRCCSSRISFSLWPSSSLCILLWIRSFLLVESEGSWSFIYEQSLRHRLLKSAIVSSLSLMYSFHIPFTSPTFSTKSLAFGFILCYCSILTAPSVIL